MQYLRAALVVAITLAFAPASIGAEVSTLVLGTATPGGGFTVYGDALAETLRKADPTLDIRTRPTAGSKENIPLLEAGQIDLALVEGTAAYEALTGIGRSPAPLSVVAAMYPSPGMFAVRADSPYRAIADLKGRRVVFGAAGSGFVLLARYVLDGLGLDMQEDRRAPAEPDRRHLHDRADAGRLAFERLGDRAVGIRERLTGHGRRVEEQVVVRVHDAQGADRSRAGNADDVGVRHANLLR